jgi:DNA modification methylase
VLPGLFEERIWYEDELPRFITDEQYDEWFKSSFVDGVRMGKWKLPKVDLVLTDPPYGMGKFENDIEQWDFSEYIPIKDDCAIYVFCGDNSYVKARMNLEKRFSFHRTIIWEKENIYGGGDYLLSHEYILYFKYGKPIFNNIGRKSTSAALKAKGKEIAKEKSVWKSKGFNNTCMEYCGHPTQKPLQIIRKIIRNSSRPSSTILDPFMGSGTTLRAAKDLGRKAIGIEIEEKYCEIAAKRLAQEVLPL